MKICCVIAKHNNPLKMMKIIRKVLFMCHEKKKLQRKEFKTFNLDSSWKRNIERMSMWEKNRMFVHRHCCPHLSVSSPFHSPENKRCETLRQADSYRTNDENHNANEMCVCARSVFRCLIGILYETFQTTNHTR